MFDNGARVSLDEYLRAETSMYEGILLYFLNLESKQIVGNHPAFFVYCMFLS